MPFNEQRLVNIAGIAVDPAYRKVGHRVRAFSSQAETLGKRYGSQVGRLVSSE